MNQARSTSPADRGRPSAAGVNGAYKVDISRGDRLGRVSSEVRAYDDKEGRRRVALATRSDLTIEAQATAPGATWLDRQLLTPASEARNIGFGAEVKDAMDRRVEHLATEGLARRQGRSVVYARDLLIIFAGGNWKPSPASLAKRPDFRISRPLKVKRSPGVIVGG